MANLRNDVYNRLRTLLADTLGADEEEITWETNVYDDLNADTLEFHDEVIPLLEEEFDVRIDDSDVADLTTVREAVQPFGASAQLTGCLGAAKQQHCEDGPFVCRKLDVLIEDLVVLEGPPAGVGPHDPHQASSSEAARDSLDCLLIEVDDGLSVAGLVARGTQGVDGQGIRGRHGGLLLEQAAQYALVVGIENGELAHPDDSRADALHDRRS